MVVDCKSSIAPNRVQTDVEMATIAYCFGVGVDEMRTSLQDRVTMISEVRKAGGGMARVCSGEKSRA